MTDYHNNDGAQWTAAHWKTCFIIRMKLLPVYLAKPPYLIIAELAERQNIVSEALKLRQLRDVQKIMISFLQTRLPEIGVT